MTSTDFRRQKDEPSASFVSHSTANTDLEAQQEISEKNDDLDTTAPVEPQEPAAAITTTPSGPPQPPTYPTGLKLLAVLGPAFIGVFLVSLDRTIVATATPRITDEFQSFCQYSSTSVILPY